MGQARRRLLPATELSATIQSTGSGCRVIVTGMEDPADAGRRVRLALLSIRDNAKLARSFANGAAAPTLAADRRSAYAVIRALQLVARAARRLPQDLCERHPDVAWSAVRAAGNVDGVASDLQEAHHLLETLSTTLPALLRAVEAELATGRSGQPGG